MARKLRVEYPGAIYHVMNRGDYSETVLRDSNDSELFLATLAEACDSTDWQIHSFCQMTALPEHQYGGPEWQETAEKKAKRILAKGLQQRGWDAQELKRRRKGDPDKLRIARRLRTQTTMTLAWIAQSLSMGAPGSLANALKTIANNNMRLCWTGTPSHPYGRQHR